MPVFMEKMEDEEFKKSILEKRREQLVLKGHDKFIKGWELGL
jgi:hypothetical protein